MSTQPDALPPGNIRLPVTAAVMLAFLLRIWLIARSELSGDEAVFGLMSFAIARGREFPLYCWGAHYASALISYLAVPSMAFLGPSPFSFKLPTILYAVFLAPLVFFALARSFDVFNSWLSALALAAPLPTMLEYSTLAHGGYPETYFLGFAIWVAAIGAASSGRERDFAFAGFLMGASFAILWLGLPFIASALALLAWKRALRPRPFVALAAGFVLGSLPFWIYNLWLAPGATFRRLGARSLAATPQSGVVASAMERVVHLPRWGAESVEGLGQLFAPLGGFAAAVIVIALAAWGGASLAKKGSAWGVLVVSFLASLVLFNLAGNLTRDRQWTTLLPAVVVAAQGFGRFGTRVILIPLLVAGLYADVRLIRNARPDPVILGAAEMIRSNNADGLFADYDLGYPIAFRLQGLVPISATMPPNASDRRPDWTASLSDARRPAFLLPAGEIARGFEHALVEDHVDFASFSLGPRILYVPYAASSPAPLGRTLPALIPLAPEQSDR